MKKRHLLKIFLFSFLTINLCFSYDIPQSITLDQGMKNPLNYVCWKSFLTDKQIHNLKNIINMSVIFEDGKFKGPDASYVYELILKPDLMAEARNTFLVRVELFYNILYLFDFHRFELFDIEAMAKKNNINYDISLSREVEKIKKKALYNDYFVQQAREIISGEGKIFYSEGNESYKFKIAVAILKNNKLTTKILKEFINRNRSFIQPILAGSLYTSIDKDVTLMLGDYYYTKEAGGCNNLLFDLSLRISKNNAVKLLNKIENGLVISKDGHEEEIVLRSSSDKKTHRSVVHFRKLLKIKSEFVQAKKSKGSFELKLLEVQSEGLNISVPFVSWLLYRYQPQYISQVFDNLLQKSMITPEVSYKVLDNFIGHSKIFLDNREYFDCLKKKIRKEYRTDGFLTHAPYYVLKLLKEVCDESDTENLLHIVYNLNKSSSLSEDHLEILKLVLSCLCEINTELVKQRLLNVYEDKVLNDQIRHHISYFLNKLNK